MLQTYTVSGSFSSSWAVYGILFRNPLGPSFQSRLLCELKKMEKNWQISFNFYDKLN